MTTKKQPTKRPLTKQQVLTLVQGYMDEAVELCEPFHEESREMYRYLEGDQLPEDIVAKLLYRGQPIRWENIIEEIDSSLDGLKRTTKTELEIQPRHAEDLPRTQILTQLHRATIDSTEWWSDKAQSDLDLRIAGISAIDTQIRLLSEYDAHGKQLKETTREVIPALECFPDLYARRPDYSDARYFHHSRMYHIPTLERRFPAAKSIAQSDRGFGRVHRTWYIDTNTQQRMIALWAEGVLLETVPQPSDRLDRFSVSVRKTLPKHGKGWRSMYRNVKPFQDDINNHMLRLKNMLSSFKALVEASAVEDVDLFAEEFSVDSAVVTVADGTLTQKRIEIINMQTNIAQIMSLIQDARVRALQIMGVNPELLGTSTTRQSGVALEIKQNAGLIGLQKFMATSNELDKDVFEAQSRLIEEHYDAEQVYAVTKDDKSVETFYINAYKRHPDGSVVYEDGKPQQETMLHIGRYDITVTQVPYNNGSSDAKMKNWAEVMKILPQDAVIDTLPIMLRDVGSPQATAALEMLQSRNDAAANATEDPVQQAQMQELQLRLDTMEKKLAETESRTEVNHAKAALDQAKADEIKATAGVPETPAPPAQTP